jgi:hypothetical protein
MLKKRYTSQDDIPEAAKAFYTKADSGDWILDLEGEDNTDKGKVAEFRQKNIELIERDKAITAKLAAFDGVDPETVKRALASLSKQQDEQVAGMMKRGEFDKVLEMEKGRLAQSHQAQLDALQGERNAFETKAKTLGGRFGDILLAQKIDEAMTSKKLRPHANARADLMARAKLVFSINDAVDDITPSEGVYDAKGKPYTAASWLDVQVAQAGHLFEGGTGGGAGRSGTGNAGKALYNRDDFQSDPEGFAKVSAEINDGKAAWQE